MARRLQRDESGFGLVELLIAMMVLSVGILAIVAAFTSGAFSLQRASRLSTATAIADAQMERYRALRYGAIALDTASVDAAASTSDYEADTAIGGDVTKLLTVANCSASVPADAADACTASRSTTGPDGRQYRVDTYVLKPRVETAASPTNAAGREVKLVTVVVRDEGDAMKPLIREQSAFDQSTGT